MRLHEYDSGDGLLCPRAGVFKVTGRAEWQGNLVKRRCLQALEVPVEHADRTTHKRYAVRGGQMTSERLKCPPCVNSEHESTLAVVSKEVRSQGRLW